MTLFQHGPRQLQITPWQQSIDRSYIKFTDQLKTLINTFNQKPYPDYATKWRLAFNNTEEPRIQIWFQNQRARTDSRKDQNLRRSQNQAKNKITLKGRCKAEKTDDTLLATLPSNHLPSFPDKSYPESNSLKELSLQIWGQIWFQKYRSRFWV